MSVVLGTIFIFLDLFESLAQFLKLFFNCVCVYIPVFHGKEKTIMYFFTSVSKVSVL